MEKEKNDEKKECCKGKKWNNTKAGSSAGAGAVYCLGLIGAAVYYIQNASSFWDGVVGLLQALVWPAMLVYNLFESLNM
ncbi:MAG: hypothetical protein WCI63_03855 [bacterium]